MLPHCTPWNVAYKAELGGLSVLNTPLFTPSQILPPSSNYVSPPTSKSPSPITKPLIPPHPFNRYCSSDGGKEEEWSKPGEVICACHPPLLRLDFAGFDYFPLLTISTAGAGTVWGGDGGGNLQSDQRVIPCSLLCTERMDGAQPAPPPGSLLHSAPICTLVNNSGSCTGLPDLFLVNDDISL